MVNVVVRLQEVSKNETSAEVVEHLNQNVDTYLALNKTVHESFMFDYFLDYPFKYEEDFMSRMTNDVMRQYGHFDRYGTTTLYLKVYITPTF